MKMNPFDSHCTETIHVRRKQGEDLGPLKAAFGKGRFAVFDNELDISAGDCIDRPLPNGKAERYDIVEVNYATEFHGIPGHVDMTVRKQGSLVTFEKSRVTNISINNSQGFQVGDHNTQNIVDAFKQIIEGIEKSSGTPEEKAEAKSRLSQFLKHPLTSAVIGKAVEGAIGLLK
jgi:hypothetical protein